MKRICLFLIAFTLLLAGCNSNKVKVRGKVIGLQGTVKLLAEMPGQQGLVILAQQDVTDGNIDLETEALQIPARVWVDVAGKNTLEFILDSKDYSETNRNEGDFYLCTDCLDAQESLPEGETVLLYPARFEAVLIIRSLIAAIVLPAPESTSASRPFPVFPEASLP